MGPDSHASADSVSGASAPGPPAPADAAGRDLPRDLAQVLTGLSIALQRRVMYPPGHPSLVPVLDGLARRLQALLDDRPRVAVGVARDQLVIEGVASDPRHPLLRSLAERLHRHHLAVLEFARGLTSAELFAVIEALASDPERDGRPLGARSGSAATLWPHVVLHALSVDGLAIVDSAGGEPRLAGTHGDTAARCMQLWVGLANAALERARGVAAAEGALAQPAVIARAINEHEQAAAYDQVVVGYLMQIADELRAGAGQDADELRRRTAQLMGALQPETLRRLLDMGGDQVQRQRFLSDVVCGMTASAVVDVVEAAAGAAHETLSSGLLRLLSKLAVHAEFGAERVRPIADTELRGQVQRLIGDWHLADPHPDDYRDDLDQLAHTVPADLSTVASDDAENLALRVVQISLEVEEHGPALDRAIDTLVASGSIAPLLDLLRAPDAGPLARELLTRLASLRTTRALLGRARPDFAGVEALLALLDGQALEPIVDILTESDDRQQRRAAFDLLRRVGAAALPLVRPRLADPRWYVVRNVLALVSHLDPPPEDPDPAPWLTHADPRVRREAVRLALRRPPLRERALVAALGDSDPGVVTLALLGVQDACPPAAIDAVLALASDERSDDLRAAALRALAAVGDDPRALTLLLDAAVVEIPFLPWRKPSPASGPTLAALTALATAWHRNRRAAARLRRARRSPDAEVRRAAGRRT